MNIISNVLLLGCCITLQQFAKQVEAAGGEWDYGQKGPQTDAWCKVADVCCSGGNQSPINLDLKVSKFDNTQPFQFKDYDKAIKLTAVNNGHTAVFSQDPKSSGDGKPGFSGGGLNTNYTLHSFHFHWGSNNSVGSEHLDNGFQYAAEAHFVHFRSDFANLGAAVQSGQPNALAVLGVFYGVGGDSSDALKTVTDTLKSITTAQKTAKVSKAVKIMDLLPFNKVSLYRYGGSLTTPNCNEVVAWTVFTNAQYLSDKQINSFRQLQDEGQHKLVDNFRPPKPLGKRTLYRLEAKSG